MWIFGKNGVLSIVRHRTKRGYLMIRAITRADITNHWPDAKITCTPAGDYRYRTTLPDARVIERIAKAIAAIDYDKVKPAILDKSKSDLHMSVFFSMMDYQDTACAALRRG